MKSAFTASLLAQKTLSSSDLWPDDAVIRAPVFDAVRLQQHAISLAESHRTGGEGVSYRRIKASLVSNQKILSDARDRLMRAVTDGETITPAGEWLVDNFHIISQHTQQAIEDLPSGYYRQLPKIRDGHLAGQPRVAAIAWAYIAHTDCQVAPQQLADFINAYQTVSHLTIGELWALAIHLRILLIENAARVARRTLMSHDARQSAQKLAEAFAAGSAGIDDVRQALMPLVPHVRLSYIVELHRLVHGKRPLDPQTIAKIGEGLDLDLHDLTAAAHDEHARQVANNLTMQNIFTSLKTIGETEWEPWFQMVSAVDAILSRSPRYHQLSRQSRTLYRRAIEDLAQHSGNSETEVAKEAVAVSEEKDTGFALIGGERRQFEQLIGYRPPLPRRLSAIVKAAGIGGYLAVALALAVVIAVVAASSFAATAAVTGTVQAVLFVLLMPLAIEAALAMVNYAATQLMRPVVLPALDFENGIPDEHRTMIAVPTLLSSYHGVNDMADLIEGHFLSNDDANLSYAIVSDWRDAPSEHMPDDEALLGRLKEAVAALNHKHGHDRFLLFHRARRWNAAQGAWMGWERKRGKLHELNRLLRGAEDTSFISMPPRIPQGVRHVIVLDADTLLPRGAAARLVGKIAHPLNTPVVDAGQGRVTRGYGILQPRVATLLPERGAGSLYFSLSVRRPGVDPYVFASSDVYQDLFGEGTFTGKGLYDIDAFEAAVASRVPDNTLLSHDLFEGNFARAALVSDIEVAEDFPDRYVVDVARHHRWTRGDWQLLPWMFPPARGLSPLGWWKMFDNLRRSLSPVFTLVALLLGWWVLPSAVAATWTVAILAVLFIPAFLPVFAGSSMSREPITFGSEVRSFLDDLVHAFRLTAARLTFVAHQSAVMTDAIVRTLYRLAVSRRHLLEWTTAAQLQSTLKPALPDTYVLMWPSAALGAVVLGLGALHGDAWSAAAIPIATLWILAPAIAYFISLPQESSLDDTPSAADLGELRLVGLRTWRYFDEHVVAAHNMLPPDNLQEDPVSVVANRTSPTNIGLYMLSTVSACDLGWIGRDEAAYRLQATLDTVARMKMVRGHLLNWYDTTTLAPLEPQYVSTVDSGNFVAHLIAIANACESWKLSPMPGLDRLSGLIDLARIVREAGEATGRAHREAAAAGQRIIADIDGLIRVLEELLARPDLVSMRMMSVLVQTKHIAEQLGRLWDSTAFQDRADGAYWARALVRAAEASIADTTRDRQAHERLTGQLGAIAERCRALAYAADFSFLLHPKRGVLAIGYRAGDETLDGSCYDMLASEAALTNFFAVAKSDASEKLWARLGRPIVAVDNRACLLSWSGSMFEYLMPLLVLHAPDGTLYRQTMSLAVRRQQAYAARMGVPWGISESAYTGRDRHFTYQYSSFGVPGLGLKRGLADELVTAPYATGLAAMVVPSHAAKNYRRLAELGALGRYGYYESVDFTTARLRPNERFEVVRAYFAHHQGMTITAIHNAVGDSALCGYFHRENSVRAAELLLQERAPNYLPVKTTIVGREAAAGRRAFEAGFAARVIEPRSNAAPQVNLLSNGRVSVMLTADGRGYTRWKGIAVNRWRQDALRGEGGMAIILRDAGSDAMWPATSWDTGEDPPEVAIFSQEKTEFRRTDHDIACHVECLVSSEQDVEVRVVELVNMSDARRRIEFTSCCELALAHPDADEAHPAFSKLFVETAYDAEHQTLLATRRRRLDDDPDIWVAQFLLCEDGDPSDLDYDTSRESFRGRAAELRHGAAMTRRGPLAKSLGDVLDPVFAFRHMVDLAPHQKRRVSVWTAMAESREAVLAIVANHRSAAALARVQVNAWTQSRVLLHHYSLEVAEADLFQDFASALVYSRPAYRPDPGFIARAMRPQSALWALSISGVRPIVAVKLAADGGTALVEELLKAQDYWGEKGLVADVVIINTQAASYSQSLQSDLERLVARERTNRSTSSSASGEIFLIKTDSVDTATVDGLLAAAHIALDAGRGRLADQVFPTIWPRRVPATAFLAPPSRTEPDAAPDDLQFFNGYGGFDRETGEYVVRHRPGKRLPAPWINVIANAQFGTHCSAEGGGYSWYRNSKEQQITGWSNDPLTDRPSEVFYVQDAASRLLHGPTVDPLGPRGGVFTTRHGLGYTRYEALEAEMEMQLTVTVDPRDAAKRSCLRITNRSGRRRRLLVTFYAECVMGRSRRSAAHYATSAWDAQAGLLLMRNAWNSDFGDAVVFADMDGRSASWSADRFDVLGGGSLSAPPPIVGGLALGKRAGGGLDPCLALQVQVELLPHASDEIVVNMGAAASLEAARELSARLRGTPFADTLEAQRRQWAEVTGTVTVKSPDPSFDVMMNGWLIYQTLSGRFWARSGFYQASGAYGFRDQLQDSMAVAHVRPDLTRQHILRAAARQFVEGDVQHWWLPSTGAGVRTHISDDTSWLAYCTAHYLHLTGDTGILDEELGFLSGAELPLEAHDRFFVPEQAADKASLYEHCARGIDRAMKTGAHGLPLMGTGDWNDGMNEVGAQGRGESVWLGWMLCRVLDLFAPIAEDRGDHDRAGAWRAHRQTLAAALDSHGWDGAWYRRAYFDDGTPLGTASSDECRIDTIAQSWAVMSGAAKPERAREALDSAQTMLVDEKSRIAHLFLPPLEHHRPSAGYIQSYPPGVRENGGQYTHGALWAIFAHALLGNREKAYGLFALINPVNHTATAEDVARYRVEPYVIAADVYSHGGYAGRGGWTWYTGAAGWAYRAGLEALLGLSRQGDTLTVKPCLPSGWQNCEVTLRHQGKQITLVYARQDAPSAEAGAGQVIDLAACSDGERITVRLAE